MLKGLSDENSWRLFVLTAFERESDEANDPELSKIGKKIVKKCSNVPLAIKVLGTLLYGQTNRWESFEKNRLPQIEIAKNPIMSILKLSYNNLEPSVKNCFAYCALFPKDYEMEKRKLISLWMAQGYIGDCEDYFLILLKRCFFQDVKRNYLGDIVSFKMHDLMHDLAQEVSGDEIFVDSIVEDFQPNNLGNLSNKVRHLYVDGEEWIESHFPESNIRTCFIDTCIDLDLLKPLVSNWRCLRSLRLCAPLAHNLSKSIGELLHLRYLDLSVSACLNTLPNSITKLYNLQSLIMRNSALTEWPKDFHKLVNLRLLDIRECEHLTCMPLGVGKLTNLRDLTDFHVGEVSSSNGKQFGGQLKDLKLLVNLRGALDIRIYENLASETDNVWEGSYLEPINNLKAVRIYFPSEACVNNNEALIEKLQPNRNLVDLCLEGYKGTEIPRWGRGKDDRALILPRLVSVEISDCRMLDGIPLLSNLKHLKFLILSHLDNLEYMEISTISRIGNSGSKDIPFFPSLDYLHIEGLKRLRGWWKGVGEGDSSSSMPHWQPPFPRLSRLAIIACPELTYLPPCPSLESLKVKRSNKALRILPGEVLANFDLKLRVKEIDSVGYLTTLPACRLAEIVIKGDGELNSLSEMQNVLKNCSSLQSLTISFCTRLTSVSGMLEHLTALESLSLINLPALGDDEDDPDDDIPWRSLSQNLCSLELKSLDIQNLPTWVKHLTALQNLTISVSHLKVLPEWISCLSSLHSLKLESCYVLKSLDTIRRMTSLQKLDIIYCPKLWQACKEPSGKEWPNIRHIPNIYNTTMPSSE